MIATPSTRTFLGLVAGWMLIGASALVAGPVVSADGKPAGRPAPAAQLAFSNSNPAVLAHLAAEGIVGGEQVNLAGRPLGALVVDGPLAAAYPIADGDQRATLVLDYGKDFYRFAGASECAGVVEVSWPEPVLEAQIRAGLRESGRDAYVTQAVSTIGQPTTREHLAVRGGGRFRIEASWSQGLDDSGNAATFTRTIDAAVACDQILKVAMGTAGDKRPVIGSADLYLGSPAELPRRQDGRTLLDAELAIEQTFDNGESSLCNTDDFTDGDLSGWTFANIGDSDQGGVTALGGKLQLTTDGTTYYHDPDSGGFVYQNVNGDFRAQVKITGFPVDAGGGYRKAGLTVRTGTGPNDPRVYASFLPMHPFYNQTAIMFDYRDAAGNEFELSSTPLNLALPAWVSIERKGDKFTVYYSANGTKWTKALGAAGGTATIPMPGSVLVGLMGASYDANVTMTSEFDDFKVCRPNVIPLPPLPPPGACAPGTPIDIVYLLDSTGSMTVPFASGGVTKLDAARNAMVELNDLIEANLPGSRGALVTFRGGFTPAFNQNNAVNILSNLTTDFDAVDAAAASIDVNSIDPDDTTPISIALDRTLTMLQNQGSYQSLPVVIFIGDGWPNIDWEGHGPLEYLVSEMGAISIIDSGNFIPWGAAAWLGNWNGAINTYDGKPLADAMYQTLRMKSTIPEMLMFTVGVHSDGIFRPDLLSFMAAYTGGSFYEVEDANELVEVLEGIYNGLGCAPDVGADIGDTVWNDANGDGVQNGGELGLPGVTVELVDGNGDVVATEVTDGSGHYLFEDVDPGTYTVRVVPSTLPGGSDVQTYDFDGVGTPHAAVVTVEDEDVFLDADFGYRSSAGTIGDRVWNDANGDGVQDGGENGLPGVTVELVDGGGNVIATDVTDGNGNYLFENVAAGTYTVRVVSSTIPANHDPTYDRDGVGTPHVAANVTVADGQSVLDVDFGYEPSVGTIGDRVWKDTDGDGVQDGGEGGLSGVTVELVDGGGNVVMTDVTDGSGNYLFENVTPGTYTVRVVSSSVPAGYTPTYDRDGIATPHVAVVTVNGGQTILDVDYGYRLCAGKIGDRVWDDKDGDGVQDSGETGYSGVTVQLLDGGGNVIATQVTNSSGNYYFTNVAAGTYTVKVVASTLPASATPTFDKDGVITPHTAVVTVSCNQHVLDVDFGYRECAGKIGDRVWDDKDGDGVQDSGEVGFSGVTVELLNAGGTVIQTKVTNSSGNYYFTNVAPGSYTVRVVASTLPAGASATYDKDGIVTLHTAAVTITCGQQVTNIDFGYRVCSASIGDKVWDDKNGNGTLDSGETGIAGVTVELVNSGGTVLQTKVTNSSGYYNFTNVQPGTYTVRIVASTLPAGATATYDKDGIATLHQSAVTVTCYQVVTNIDFGYKFCSGTIGDKVWDDKDGDGVVDSGEVGIGGVTVQLYSSGGTLLATKVTNSSGYYAFEGVQPGTYTVKVVAASLPSGMNPTWDKDGTATPHQATITLSCNQSYTNVDFGYRSCSSSVGDLVWDDKDKDGRKDSGETGIPGITVQLLNSGGTVIATDVTDSNGKYLFENLQPGTYSVRVLTTGMPAGAHPTYDKDGTGTANIATFTLSCNQSKSDIDFGYWMPPPSIIAGCVWEDKNDDGKRAGGEVGFPGVTVQLLSGTTVIATTTTNGSGDYSFQNLTAGTYTVKVVSSTLPADAIATHDYDGLGSLHKATVTVELGEEIWDVCFGYKFEDDDVKWCPRTPGFWKNHPEEWPVSSLRFGNVTYNTSQLMTFLNYGGSDAATRLAHHLTATMLNLAKGSEPYIQSTVNSASTFLVTYPPGSNPQGSAKNQANSLKDKLDKYNNDEKDCKKDKKRAPGF
jgi:protocatechuate 3,4-dioxygenase beta subunit/regulation of enolase protein 1 (concanavalin A-like superfamily)